MISVVGPLACPFCFSFDGGGWSDGAFSASELVAAEADVASRREMVLMSSPEHPRNSAKTLDPAVAVAGK